jgi:hypothetical protein
MLPLVRKYTFTEDQRNRRFLYNIVIVKGRPVTGSQLVNHFKYFLIKLKLKCCATVSYSVFQNR